MAAVRILLTILALWLGVVTVGLFALLLVPWAMGTAFLSVLLLLVRPSRVVYVAPAARRRLQRFDAPRRRVAGPW